MDKTIKTDKIRSLQMNLGGNRARANWFIGDPGSRCRSISFYHSSELFLGRRYSLSIQFDRLLFTECLRLGLIFDFLSEYLYFFFPHFVAYPELVRISVEGNLHSDVVNEGCCFYVYEMVAEYWYRIYISR